MRRARWLQPKQRSAPRPCARSSRQTCGHVGACGGRRAQQAQDPDDAGGLGGTTFGGLTTTNLPSGFAANLSYTATNVILNLTAQLGTPTPGPNAPGPNAPGPNTLSGNPQNIATALNNFFNN